MKLKVTGVMGRSLAGMILLSQLIGSYTYAEEKVQTKAQAKPDSKNAVAEANSSSHGSTSKWQQWPDDQFAEAKKERKLIILDLEAIWCHWCHVMDEKTYSNAAVNKILDSDYIVTVGKLKLYLFVFPRKKF